MLFIMLRVNELLMTYKILKNYRAPPQFSVPHAMAITTTDAWYAWETTALVYVVKRPYGGGLAAVV